jgi:hypothetical protein
MLSSLQSMRSACAIKRFVFERRYVVTASWEFEQQQCFNQHLDKKSQQKQRGYQRGSPKILNVQNGRDKIYQVSEFAALQREQCLFTYAYHHSAAHPVSHKCSNKLTADESLLAVRHRMTVSVCHWYLCYKLPHFRLIVDSTVRHDNSTTRCCFAFTFIGKVIPDRAEELVWRSRPELPTPSKPSEHQISR